ncbi:MAG: hypothetical protein LBT76_02775 [Tannerella sp.]|nr:hypothetical protein [Tannerella sp.]
MEITVQTNEHGDRTVSRSTDGARHVSTARHAADRANTNKGACPLADRGEATHPVGDGSSVENRSVDPLASRTGCNINVSLSFLPNSHSSRNGGAAIARTTVRQELPVHGKTSMMDRNGTRSVQYEHPSMKRSDILFGWLSGDLRQSAQSEFLNL